MSIRVTSSHFVGRATELAECEAALREAAQGSPSVIALSGDSGVGKTRLISAFEAMTAGRARFLRGECVELGEGELPYGPLIGALRELARCGDPVLDRLSSGARASLGALLPSLGWAEGTDRDDASAQMRLFEALLELLELLGEELPVVLVIEDLHWADRSTRAFTAFLARSLRRERVLFLFSYRADELHRRHPLRGLLSDLDHGEGTRRLAISPWAREELDEALADILGAAPREDLLKRMFARAEGNPLYTEELLAAGLDGRGAAPQSLRDAFMLRLERLPSVTQHALRVLAVAGRADEPLLATVTTTSAAELTAALREAVAGRVVEVGSDGRFAFRHALLREVAYEDLLPGERASLHLSLAHALDELRRGGGANMTQIAAQVAAHAQAAGERPLALRAAIEAAAEASAIHAHGEAADLLERALESWSHIENPVEVSGIDHVELLLRGAAAHDHDDQPTRAEAMLRSALTELDEQAEPVRTALVLEQLARAQWHLARGDEALRTARRALELLPTDGAEAERASLLAWLARTTLLRGRYRDALPAAREALEAVRHSGAGKPLESRVLNTLGMALTRSGAVEEGIGELRAALALARDSGAKSTQASAYANLADLLLANGHTEEALSIALEGYEEISANAHSAHLWLGTSVAEAALAIGDWELAARNLELEDRKIEGRWLINLRLRQAELALGVGQLEPAAKALEEIEGLVDRTLEPQFHASFGLALADLHRRRGELDCARRALEEALGRIELCTDDAMRVTLIAVAGVAVEADLAQLARDQGNTGAATEAVQRAEVHIARARTAAENAGRVEAIWLQTGEAELGRALGADDPERWSQAARGWDAIAHPYMAARIRLREAEAHLERGEREQGGLALKLAHATASALGSQWLTAELDQLAARARISPASQGEAAVEETEDPFGLTPREREVLSLVARGATNREIGSELFMAEKTASVHVSRILAKLDVRTRTQAAAVAHRAGLLLG